MSIKPITTTTIQLADQSPDDNDVDNDHQRDNNCSPQPLDPLMKYQLPPKLSPIIDPMVATKRYPKLSIGRQFASQLKSLVDKNRANNRPFVCRQNGCRKVFYNKRVFDCHKSHHRLNRRSPVDHWLNIKHLVNELDDNRQQQQPSTSKANANDNHLKVVDKNLPIDTSAGVATRLAPLVADYGFSSFKDLEVINNTAIDVFMGLKLCVCKICGHESYGRRAKTNMAVHINSRHLRRYMYRCDIRGCDRQYATPNALRAHKMNHLCGFSINNGRQMASRCGNDNINRFRLRVMVNGMKFFACRYRYDDRQCNYQSPNHNAIKRHIHQHLCPFRTHSRTDCHQSGLNGIDIIKQFNKFGQLIQKDGKQLFQCIKCDFISTGIQGLVAHIRNKHYRLGDKVSTMTSAAIKTLNERVVRLDLDLETSHSADNSLMDNTLIDGKVSAQDLNQSVNNKLSYDSDDENTDTADEGLRPRKRYRKKHKKSKRYEKWVPFKCSYCYRRFDDLLILRKHQSKHH